MNLVNSEDYNVDLNGSRIVQEYEKRYGEIILDSIDRNRPIMEPVQNTLPEKRVKQIVLHHRNQYIARQVNGSEHTKIIILYGAEHKEGILSELQKLNPTWKKEM